MHRHGYKGRKFHRERDQRSALVQGIADSLIKYESIETTLPKAKEVVPYVERLITKAKKGDLHNRRQIIGSLQTVETAHKLVDEIAPRLTGRSSGHLKIEKVGYRRGDRAQMARVSFVDDVKAEEATKEITTDKQSKTSEAPERSTVKQAPASGKLADNRSAKASSHVQAPKRTGRRGDR